MRRHEDEIRIFLVRGRDDLAIRRTHAHQHGDLAAVAVRGSPTRPASRPFAPGGREVCHPLSGERPGERARQRGPIVDVVASDAELMLRLTRTLGGQGFFPRVLRKHVDRSGRQHVHQQVLRTEPG